jgi:hypothetical protein
MSERQWPDRAFVQNLRSACYDREVLEQLVSDWASHLNTATVRNKRNPQAYLITQGVGHFFDHLDQLDGKTLADRWMLFESFWIKNVKGRDLTAARFRNSIFLTPLMLRLVVPSDDFLGGYRALNWVRLLLPPDAPLRALLEKLAVAITKLPNMSYSQTVRASALHLATRTVLINDYWSLSDFQDSDLLHRRGERKRRFKFGSDALDAALCTMGIFNRTPLRGIVRERRPVVAPTLAEMVRARQLPDEYREVTQLYLEAYQVRISSRYSTLRSKLQGLARFWRFMKVCYPQIASTAGIRPEHIQVYIPHSLALARANCRSSPSGVGHGSTTANHDLATVRTFFSDISTWSIEEASPFQEYAPPALPLSFRETQVPEISQAFRQQEAAMTRRIIDLEREMPRVRALAHEQWQAARDQLANDDSRAAWRAEAVAFWNWAFIELLVQSGLRIEEAHNLTVFDILRRTDSSGRAYFLHREVNAAAIENFAVNYRRFAPMAREWARLTFENKVWGAGEADDRKPETLALGARWTATLTYGEWQMGTVSDSGLEKTEPVPGRDIPDGGAVIAQLSPDEFLLTGNRVRVSFGSAKGERFMIAKVEEGHYDKGQWVFERIWNGDQIASGINLTALPQVLKVKLAAY